MSDDEHEYTVSGWLERGVTITVSAPDWEAAEWKARKKLRARLADEGVPVEEFDLSLDELVRNDRRKEADDER